MACHSCKYLRDVMHEPVYILGMLTSENHYNRDIGWGLYIGIESM